MSPILKKLCPALAETNLRGRCRTLSGRTSLLDRTGTGTGCRSPTVRSLRTRAGRAGPWWGCAPLRPGPAPAAELLRQSPSDLPLRLDPSRSSVDRGLRGYPPLLPWRSPRYGLHSGPERGKVPGLSRDDVIPVFVY